MKHGEKLCIDHCPRCGCESAPRVDWEYDEMHGRNWIFEHYTCPECGKEYTEQYLYIGTWFEEEE